MNAKEKGSRREREVRDFLLQRGFKVCKAGASLGDWDLIAVNDHVFLLVQVKSNRFCYPAERQTLESFKAPAHACKLQAQVRDHKGIAFRAFKEGGWRNVKTVEPQGVGWSAGPPAWFKPPKQPPKERNLAL